MEFRKTNERNDGGQFKGVGVVGHRHHPFGLDMDQNGDANLLLDDSTTNSNNSREDNKNRTTDAQTMMHILKANIGTGVLAMPNAFKNVGLWLGFILVPIIGAICIHCMNILIASHNHLCDKFNYESLDYDQVAALGLACGPKFTRRLAKYTHIVVTTFLIVTQVGFCCVYIMFVVENLQLAILNLFKVQYSTSTYLMLVFPIIGLTSCTSNLKHLARISTFANMLQLTGLALIFFDLLQFHTYSTGGLFSSSSSPSSLETNEPHPTNGTTTHISTSTSAASHQQHLHPQQQQHEYSLLAAPAPVKVEVSPWASKDIVAGLPLFFATAVYAFEGIGVVLPLIKEMQYPSRISGLNGVLDSSMAMVAVLYMAMGFFGYAKYGQFVQGSITLNLPETALNELVRLIFAIAIGLSYSLQFYVPWTIMWPHIDESLFYSYRPRAARDKLEILNKLSAENEWAIDRSECHQQQQRQQQQVNRQTASGLYDQDDDDESRLAGHTTEQQQDQMLDYNSTASTFATSYSMSTCLPAANYQQQQLSSCGGNKGGRMRTNLSSNLMYGSISMSGSHNIKSSVTGSKKHTQTQRRRNRLEDVMEQAEDSLPEVQWRPPPRSMRGKRKLVRYTVILVTVSFTFVAAALIPRLDLFISLIGALASSCLAIIFPAIIQTCTFWEDNDDDDDDDDEDNGDDDDQAQKGAGRQVEGGQQQQTRRSKKKKGWLYKRLLWSLFVFKNLFLIVFGILGLITGSWISISQLGALYMGIDA